MPALQAKAFAICCYSYIGQVCFLGLTHSCDPYYVPALAPSSPATISGKIWASSHIENRFPLRSCSDWISKLRLSNKASPYFATRMASCANALKKLGGRSCDARRPSIYGKGEPFDVLHVASVRMAGVAIAISFQITYFQGTEGVL